MRELLAVGFDDTNDFGDRGIWHPQPWWVTLAEGIAGERLPLMCQVTKPEPVPVKWDSSTGSQRLLMSDADLRRMRERLNRD